MKPSIYMKLMHSVLFVIGASLALTTTLGIDAIQTSSTIRYLYVALMLFTATTFGYELRNWVSASDGWRDRQFMPKDRHEWIDLIGLAFMYSGIFIPKVWVWFLSQNHVVFVMIAIACVIFPLNRFYFYWRTKESRKQRLSDLQTELLIVEKPL